MTAPIPTPIYRLMHVENLELVLRRGALHAPNHSPEDGLIYRTIHNVEIQGKRHERPVDCGPGGVIHDYVGFYFGPLSPMHLQLKTGQVVGYTEGQEPLIYVTSTVQAVIAGGCQFVFSDGQGIAAFTDWYEDLADLEQVDWEMVGARYWADTVDDMDRQRRKQAEFLVHRMCPLGLIDGIAVINDAMRALVERKLGEAGGDLRLPVAVRPEWYYY